LTTSFIAALASITQPYGLTADRREGRLDDGIRFRQARGQNES
jgi:hypothetical protein